MVRGALGLKIEVGAGASVARSAAHIAVQSIFDTGASSSPGCPLQCPTIAVSWLVGMGDAATGALVMPIGIRTSASSVKSLSNAAVIPAT